MFLRKETPGCVNISSKQLIKLLESAIQVVSSEINNHYLMGPEIMFEYGDNVHFVGVKYDKRKARHTKCTAFNEKFLSVYLDKQIFRTVADLVENATVDGIKLRDIDGGLRLHSEYKVTLENF